MDCCNSTPTSSRPAQPETAPPEVITDCPACGRRGRRVPEVTLTSLLRPKVERRAEAYRFCATPGCEVAWFGEVSGHRLPVSASRVRIGQKEDTPDRRLCYCFGYVAADVVAEVAATGSSTIPGTIGARCRAGEDHCSETNPQGSCCLGNVRAVMKAAMNAAPQEAAPQEAVGADVHTDVDACGCHCTPEAIG